MSEPGAQSAAEGASVEGRPSAGQALAQTLADSAARRAKSRNVGTLRRLAPFLAAHWGRAGAAFLFLLLSSSATLGMSWAIRQVVDHLTDKGLDPATVDQRFIWIGAEPRFGFAPGCAFWSGRAIGCPASVSATKR